MWSWDFVEDQTENGSRFRILTLIDEYTRRCLATHVAWSIRAVDVITVVEAAMERYGTPQHLRSDNGPEFIAYAIQDWLQGRQVKAIYISSWENGHIESFHDQLRDELLNREVFGRLLEARVVIEQWRCEYNQNRPHSSPGYQTPEEFTARCLAAVGLRPSLRLLGKGPRYADSRYYSASPPTRMRTEIEEGAPNERFLYRKVEDSREFPHGRSLLKTLGDRRGAQGLRNGRI